MSYDNPGRATRPPSRSSSAPAMGSTVAIVVTAIAVLLAFFILRKVNDSGETSTVTPGTQASDTTAATLPGDTTFTSVVTSTTTSFTKVGTSIQVVNVSNQEGVARNMSVALAAEGFTMVEPATGTIDLPVTKIIYNPDDAAALNVANTLATYLSDCVVEPSGAVLPTEVLGTWAPGSAVAVLLGDDLAGKTLAQIAGLDTTGTTGPATSAP